ncbi:MAG: DUF6804 family protein [Candidatus Thorarchaeota archaeon]
MSDIQKQIFIPSMITSVLLLIAIFPIKQYSFFILLRWVVFISAIYVGYFMCQAKKPTWVWIMGIIVVLFNPIVPIHLSKGIWQAIDFVTAIIFILVIVTARRER